MFLLFCLVYLQREQISDKENHLIRPLGIPKPCGLDEFEALGTVGHPVNFHRKKSNLSIIISQWCVLFITTVSAMFQDGNIPLYAKEASRFYRMLLYTLAMSEIIHYHCLQRWVSGFYRMLLYTLAMSGITHYNCLQRWKWALIHHLQWLMFIVNLTDHRITWEMELWACMGGGSHLDSFNWGERPTHYGWHHSLAGSLDCIK